MYDQNYNNQNYGWGNAVADILGAVLRRNQQRAQADIISDPLSWAEKQGQGKPVLQTDMQQPPVNQGLLQKATGLLSPNTNFAPQLAQNQPPATSATLGSNLSLFNSNTQTPRGLLPSTSFSIQPQLQNNDQQAQFDAAVKSNPEWYRKGVSPGSMTYVGDRPDLAKDATVTSGGVAVNLNQPTTQVATPDATQKSLIPDRNIIRQQYKQYGSAAIKKLVSTGMPAKDAIALVQNSINQRTDEDFATQAETYAQSLDNQLDPLMGLDFQTSGNKAKFLSTLARYNQGMKRIGRDGADLGIMRDLMSQGDITMQKEDNGGQYRYVMVKKNGERFDDGSFQMPVPGNAGEWTDKTLTPSEVQTGQLQRENMQNQKDIAGMRIANSNSRGSNAADNQQITNAKYALAKHEQWMQQHTNKLTGETPDERQSPYYNYAKSANQTLDSYYGIDNQSNGGGSEPDYNVAMSKVGSLLDGKHSRQQIEAAIRQDYGDSGLADKIIQDTDWGVLNKGSNQGSYNSYIYGGD